MSSNPIHIVVLLRETCDPRPPVRLTADEYAVRERGLRRIANPADLCALEQALTLAARHQGQVTAVAIGPQRLDDHLHLALAMGADRAVRVWSSALQDSDSSSEARLYERTFEILKPDVVLSGNRLLDRGADPASALAAARQGMPYVTAALEVDYYSGAVEVLRKSDRGSRQRVATSLPCLLLFEAGCCEPRYPDQDGLMHSLQQQIEHWDEAELGLQVSEVGAFGARLGKDKCSFPRPNPRRTVTPDAQLPAFDRILALLSGGLKPRAGTIHALPPSQTVEKLLSIFEAEGLLGEQQP